MGHPKLLLPLDGRPMIHHAVSALVDAGLADVVVVVPPEHTALADAVSDLPVRLAVNPAPAAGQAGSVVAGIAALSPAADAAVIALGDQPRIPRAVLVGLLECYRASRKAVVAPGYREGRGNPVLFAASVFPELMQLTGDQGAHRVIDADPGRVALVPFDIPMPQDLDTPDDYESLRARRPPV